MSVSPVVQEQDANGHCANKKDGRPQEGVLAAIVNSNDEHADETRNASEEQDSHPQSVPRVPLGWREVISMIGRPTATRRDVISRSPGLNLCLISAGVGPNTSH
jgi:hypothetical protein